MASLLARLGFTPAAEEVDAIMQAEIQPLDGAELSISFFGCLCGDLHDFLRVSPTRFLFGLLDVAGKRETNSSIIDAAQACFRTSSAELFAPDELNEPDAMIELSRRLNLEIMRSAKGVRSCPAFIGCYNEELGTVCYVSAGHTPALLHDEEGAIELPATGLPLGLFSLAPTDARIVGLEPNASLVVVSRGVIEAESKRKEFGLEGVKLVLQQIPDSERNLSRQILNHVQDFLRGAPKHNDITALSLTRRGPRAVGSQPVDGVK